METPLIATISIGFVLALIFGAIAHRLRVSSLVGYLLAGICVGPYTPFFVADAHLSHEISEIGVILLMFGVGLHFSFKDLMSVKNIAIPGAIVQIVFATLMGMGVAYLFGWDLGASIIFGLALSCASTVVLLRALESRQLIDTRSGKIAIGWLIIEDLAMVLALVLLPALAGILANDNGSIVTNISAANDLADTAIEAVANQATADFSIWTQLGITLAKVTAFIALMIVVGRKFIPWLLGFIAGLGSRELFTLSVLAIAMGIAFGSAELFGVSFALGAFFAGMVLNESELSHKAAEDSLPFRDAFAVLFFVSVGMLFDPKVLIAHPIMVIATLSIIVVGKMVAAFLIAKIFRKSTHTALTISVSLAQIGEFSFILAGLGMTYELLSKDAYDLILAGAILSILLNPLLFVLLDRYVRSAENAHKNQEGDQNIDDFNIQEIDDSDVLVELSVKDHVIIIGYDALSRIICQYLHDRQIDFVIIDKVQSQLDRAEELGYTVLEGNAVKTEILEIANIKEAKQLLVINQNAFEAGKMIERARLCNPDLDIIVNARAEAELQYLSQYDPDFIIDENHELGRVIESRIIR